MILKQNSMRNLSVANGQNAQRLFLAVPIFLDMYEFTLAKGHIIANGQHAANNSFKDLLSQCIIARIPVKGPTFASTKSVTSHLVIPPLLPDIDVPIPVKDLTFAYLLIVENRSLVKRPYRDISAVMIRNGSLSV